MNFLKCENEKYINLDYIKELNFCSVQIDDNVICYKVYCIEGQNIFDETEIVIGCLKYDHEAKDYLKVASLNPTIANSLSLNSMEWYAHEYLEKRKEIEYGDTSSKNWSKNYEVQMQKVQEILVSHRYSEGKK